MKTLNQIRCLVITVAVGLLPMMGQAAESGATTNSAPTGADSGESKKPVPGTSATTSANQMDTIIVNAVPPNDNILPTSRPFNSAYGLDMSIMDTPRNVTIISRAQLDAISIESVRDFTELTSSSYSRSNFGAPTVPDIRGQSADMYVNGMRKGLTSNGNGLPINFNAFDSINIVKGPPDAVYGASQYVGGYVDVITKRPFFDQFQGSAELTVGSYRTWEQTLDFGGPILKDELAYRFSYSGKEDGGYYVNYKNRMQAGYFALSWTPKDSNYTLDFNTEFATYNYIENWGYNRPTQSLIDSGQYLTGTSTAQGLLPTGTAPVSQNAVLTRPGDGSGGLSYNFQVIQSLALDDNLKVVNNSFFQYIDRHTLDSYYYDEVLKDNISFENRTEVHWSFDMPVIDPARAVVSKDDPKAMNMAAGDPGLSFHSDVNTGVAERYQSNLNYDDYYYELTNTFDITGPLGNVYFNPGDPHIPGETSAYQFNQGNGDSTQSEMVSVGPFWQHHIDFTKEWAFNYGARVDALFVDANDPPGSLDPIVSSSTSQVLANFNASPTFKPFPWMMAYLTYNYSQYTAAANGGGYFPTGDPAAGYWTASNYHRDAELYETGLKFDLLDHTLFATVDAYIQNRIDATIGSGSDEEFRRGIEAELSYQPNKEIFMTASYSLTHAQTKNPGFVQQFEPVDELPTVGGYIQGIDTGGYIDGVGKTPGVPEHTFNFLIQYQHPSGFGGNLGVVVTSKYNLGYDSQFSVTEDYSGAGINHVGTVVIPWQYTVNASLFYKQPKWEAKLQFFNITDQRNFSPVNAIYANDEVNRDLPFEMQATLKYKF